MPPPNDPLGLVGTTVGEKYDVEAFVAEGGFSFVYRARHRVWQQPVALKFLRALQAATDDQKKRLLDDFVREGSFLRELSSRAASIVQAYDVGTMTGADSSWWPYLVLEWLDGSSLDRVLEREAMHGIPPRTLPECVRLLDPAVRALAVVHRRGIAHRDLKPGNLFVLGDPRGQDAVVKLLDFGIAKALDAATTTASNAKTNLALSPQFTPWYGAPEQFSRTFGATGPWTDVYALALVLVEMMTHRSPLVGDDLAQLAFASTDAGQRPTPREKGVPVSDAVEAVFHRAVALNPSERYQNAGDFWRALYASLGPAVGPFADEPSFVDASTTDRHASLRNEAPTMPFSPANSTTPPQFANVALPAPAPPPPAAARSSARLVVGALLVGVAAASWGGVALLRSRPSAPPQTAGAAPAETPAPITSTAPVDPCPPSMAFIPGGNFFMGYDGENGLPFEKPAHKVGVSPFCIDVTEVTVEDYRRCSDKGDCLRAATTVTWPKMTEQERKVYGPLCNVDDAGRDRHPINCVDWEMASTYCKVAGKRLPTSAEWEYAVRGPDGRIYPWGDEPPSANHLNACGSECVEWSKRSGDREIAREVRSMYSDDDGFPTTAPVGSFPKGRSRYGLDDVIGNVMEWVQDWDGPYEKVEPPPLDPTGPASGTERVLRGGAWNAGSSVWVRPSFRFKFPPQAKTHAIGFRCAAPAKGQKPAAGEAK
jgi:eukaryotic-like serine/threonine-protein kinase